MLLGLSACIPWEYSEQLLLHAQLSAAGSQTVPAEASACDATQTAEPAASDGTQTVRPRS